MDRACFELEQEIKHLVPDGRAISNTTLQHAIQLLNQKIRRKGHLSAIEIHFNRDMHSGQNLNLNYDEIRQEQLDTRSKANEKHNAKVTKQTIIPNTGDIVTIQQKNDKHIAKHPFIVTDAKDDKIKVQKVINPFRGEHTESGPKLRTKQYTTDPYRTTVIFRNSNRTTKHQKTTPRKKPTQWNPIRINEYLNDDDDEIAYKMTDVEQTSPANPQRDSSTAASKPVNQTYQDLDARLEANRRAAHIHHSTGSTEKAPTPETTQKSTDTPNQQPTPINITRRRLNSAPTRTQPRRKAKSSTTYLIDQSDEDDDDSVHSLEWEHTPQQIGMIAMPPQANILTIPNEGVYRYDDVLEEHILNLSQ